jgi:hypothetical protein
MMYQIRDAIQGCQYRLLQSLACACMKSEAVLFFGEDRKDEAE